MDPVWAAFLGSAVGGAIGGAVISGVFAWMIHISSGKREHKIWLRQLMYEFYMKQLGAMETISSMILRNSDGLRDDRIEALTDQLIGSGVEVLAPPKVNKAYADVIVSLMQLRQADLPAQKMPLVARGIPEVSAYSSAVERFADGVREELGIESSAKRGWNPQRRSSSVL
ncbi:hypothetical protein RBS60_10885 [Sinomonas sp. ASV486]|uniref:hypothetical protein n=1 Tax=Sinomonas sp. ASV486 TaxID=3051170 RepID=UPI0027DD3C2A|nr:hypothetical protein [Sinomonas sp. ASV486]MDQ4490703.1 hypothetical protein [Sinomonas sp. ASV486]